MARRRISRPLGGMLVNKEYPSFGAFVADAATGPDHGRAAGVGRVQHAGRGD